jgi:hypothetical protein
MTFRPNMPDHIKRAILQRDFETLSRGGQKSAKVRRARTLTAKRPRLIDGKSRAAGERDGD